MRLFIEFVIITCSLASRRRFSKQLAVVCGIIAVVKHLVAELEYDDTARIILLFLLLRSSSSTRSLQRP